MVYTTMIIEHQQVEELLERILSDQLELHNCRYHARRGAWSKTHASHEHFVVFVEFGTLLVRVGERTVHINGGECLWVQPGVERAVLGTADAAEVRHINLRFSVHSDRSSFGLMPSKHCLYQGVQKIRTDLDALIAWSLSYERPLSRLRYFLYGLLWQLTEQRSSQASETGRMSERQCLLLQRFVADHIADKIGPSDMSEALGLSHDYFSRVFKKTYGVNPRQYLLEERLRLAAVSLIETSLTIKDVGISVGFEDNNYFCRQFKRIMHLTPTQFRNRGYVPAEYEVD